MNSSEYRHINDELLSAYLDDAVTDQERDLVEAAVAGDRNIAWRLETLTHTVRLLNGLPELAVPRSFALQEAQVGDVLAERRLHAIRPASSKNPPSGLAMRLESFQRTWRSFWQDGNPMLRNAAVACLVLLLLLVGSDAFLLTSSLPGTQPQLAAESFSAAPAAAENSMPAVEAVAMAEPETAKTQEEPAQESAVEEEMAEPVVAMGASDASADSTAPQPLVTETENQDESAIADAPVTDDALAGEMAVAETMAPLATPAPDALASSAEFEAEGEAALARSAASLSSGPATALDGDNEGIVIPESLALPAQPAGEPEQAGASELAAETDVASVLAGAPPEAELAEESAAVEEITVPALADSPPEAESAEESAAAEEAAAPIAEPTEMSAGIQAEQEAAPTVSAKQVTAVASAPITLSPLATQRADTPVRSTQEEANRGLPNQQLQIIQLTLALLTVILTLLWWRSRSSLPSS